MPRPGEGRTYEVSTMSDFDRNAATAQYGRPLTRAEAAVVDEGLRAYMLRIYNYMVLGLAITGVAALGIYMLSVTNDPALVRDFQLFGGKIVIRRFETQRDLMTLREPVVMNCTGLGARDLFNDQELIPLKGQLTVMVPQPEVQYHTNGPNAQLRPGALGIHMTPRSDGIILGGTSQRGVWTLEPDEDERTRVVESHIAVFSGMKAPRRT